MQAKFLLAGAPEPFEELGRGFLKDPLFYVLVLSPDSASENVPVATVAAEKIRNFKTDIAIMYGKTGYSFLPASRLSTLHKINQLI